MKIHFLGTNGWFDTRLGNTLSVLLDTAKAYIVFDAGGDLKNERRKETIDPGKTQRC